MENASLIPPYLTITKVTETLYSYFPCSLLNLIYPASPTEETIDPSMSSYRFSHVLTALGYKVCFYMPFREVEKRKAIVITNTAELLDSPGEALLSLGPI